MLATVSDNQTYIPVSLATIRPESVTDFPLYLRESPEAPCRLYRDADYPFSPGDIERLVERGIKHLFIAPLDQERYQAYLRENFTAILEDESLPIHERFGCLNDVIRDVLAQSFMRRDTSEMVQTSRDLAERAVELICRDDVVVTELLHVLHHDYHTFTHSANVAFYCTLLARASGTTDDEELRQIATGGLLHDVGKLEISERILTKRGKLDEHEWEVIKRHPTTGFRLLAERNELTYDQLMIVYQHHERLDGSGYPVGRSGANIHPWAQICAVVDVYEALTSHRPYRPALPRAETIEVIDRLAKTRLNQGLWECWKTLIQD